MNTKFKLIFKGAKSDIDIARFGESLPLSFKVTEEGDGIYVTIKSKNGESEECQNLMNRELDRHFFLTSVRIRAEMVRVIMAVSVSTAWDVHNGLPEDVVPQYWGYELPIQLKLWSVAVDTGDIPLKVILFFQIIELAYPNEGDYPKYENSSKAPDPLTECKFLRNLAAHAGEVDNKKLKLYCKYLKIPESMIDRTKPEHISILSQKLGLLEKQAKYVISKSITKTM